MGVFHTCSQAPNSRPFTLLVGTAFLRSGLSPPRSNTYAGCPNATAFTMVVPNEVSATCPERNSLSTLGSADSTSTPTGSSTLLPLSTSRYTTFCETTPNATVQGVVKLATEKTLVIFRYPRHVGGVRGHIRRWVDKQQCYLLRGSTRSG